MAQRRYLSLADLCERFGVSRMWIYRRINSGHFPKPLHLGGSRLSRWRADDVEQWEADANNHAPAPSIIPEPEPIAAVAPTPAPRTSTEQMTFHDAEKIWNAQHPDARVTPEPRKRRKSRTLAERVSP